jgi:hypothetical protein
MNVLKFSLIIYNTHSVLLLQTFISPPQFRASSKSSSWGNNDIAGEGGKKNCTRIKVRKLVSIYTALKNGIWQRNYNKEWEIVKTESFQKRGCFYTKRWIHDDKKLELFNLNNERKNKQSNCKHHVDLVGQRPILRQKNWTVCLRKPNIYSANRGRQMTRKINC